jgi:hypothetical protein
MSNSPEPSNKNLSGTSRKSPPPSQPPDESNTQTTSPGPPVEPTSNSTASGSLTETQSSVAPPSGPTPSATTSIIAAGPVAVPPSGPPGPQGDQVSTRTSLPPEIESLGKQIVALDSRIARLEDVKGELMQFSFQSIIVVLTVFGLAVGVPLGIVYGGRIATTTVGLLIGLLLFALVVLTTVWLVFWWKVNNPLARIRPPP